MARYIVHNCYLALGWICLLLGGVGIFVPGLPTTIFWILSLWAFTRSSEKMRRYLLQHPKFGKILREWNDHQVVPTAGKIAACLSMSVVCVVSVLTMSNAWGATMICFTLTLVMGYIITRPSRIADVRSTSSVM
jgi:uncharacterized membrane protein YbaN (DUF454 family)